MIDLSVIMPVYNAGSYPQGWFDKAINSVLDQPINVEVCIGDDGSTDDALDAFYMGFNRNVHVVRVGEEPTGGSRAGRAAANIATGRYRIILSCRSWYFENSLAAMVKYLDDNPQFTFTYGDTFLHFPNGKTVNKIPPPFEKKRFIKSFPCSFGYMYRSEYHHQGAEYGCEIFAEDEQRWFSIGDHFLLAQIIQLGGVGKYMEDLAVLNYRYGHKAQSSDSLGKYRKQLYSEFYRLLRSKNVEVS